MSEILKAVGLTAGIGGIALGIFYFLFKRINLPKATRRHLTLFMWLVWSICVIGMAIYYFGKREDFPARNSDPTKKEIAKFTLRVDCDSEPPGWNSPLTKLFEYAEKNDGSLINVDLEFYPNDCSCDSDNEQKKGHLVGLACNLNPNWWLADRMKDFHCIEAAGLTGIGAGTETFCFPPYEKLPLKPGYSREITATHERISGEFLLSWEWSLGAPHVELLIPE